MNFKYLMFANQFIEEKVVPRQFSGSYLLV